MITGMRIENGQAIQNALRTFLPKESRKIARTATSRSSLIWKAEVKRRIQTLNMSDSGKKQYASTIGVKTKAYSAKGIFVAVVGAKSQKMPRTSVDTRITRPDGSTATISSKAAKFNNWANLSHLFEKGVAPHAIGKGSDTRKKRGVLRRIKQTGAMHPGIPAQPHILPAFFSAKAAVFSRFSVLMGELITKAQNAAGNTAKRAA